MFSLNALGIIESPYVLTIALSTTALGTLIPILKENGMFGTRFGRFAFAAGAGGEMAPIVAMALFLRTVLVSTAFSVPSPQECC
ncbi:hypothetical protein [Subtercola sp. RTI3]|nr:hypothetical protein [Subtercola sp. RTI3]MEA9985285.1 hypothetical protein [Subtercola sp. RTI3]